MDAAATQGEGMKTRHLKILALGLGLPVLYGLAASPALAQETVLDDLADGSTNAVAAIRLARQQADAGDLVAAASTLERALIEDEGADEARLAYAAILCRLGDPQSARLEIWALNDRSASRSAWKDVSTACGFKRAAPPLRSVLSGEVAMGLAYDEDSGGLLLLQPAGFATKQDGLSFVASARLSGKLALGSRYLYANANALTRDSVTGPKSDLQFGTFSAGFGTRRANKDLSFGGVLRNGRIYGDNYVTEYGGQAKLSVVAGRAQNVTIAIEGVKQNFATFGTDGWHYDLALTFETKPSEKVGYFVGIGGEYKTADQRFQEYVAGRVMGGLLVMLNDHGAYTKLSTTLRFVALRADPFNFVPSRKELRLYNRIAIGTPINDTGLNVEAALFHSYRHNNASSFLANYSSLGGELRAIWKFGSRR